MQFYFGFSNFIVGALKMFLEICILSALITFLRLFVFKTRAERLYEKFPGPKSYPIIGNVFEFDYPRVGKLKGVMFNYIFS